MNMSRSGYDEFPDILSVDHYAHTCCVTELNTLKDHKADLGEEFLIEIDMWDLVSLPKDRQAIGSRWLSKVRRHNNKSITSVDSLPKATQS